MIEFKNISNLNLDQLFQELGIADYTYVETSNFLELLEGYRQEIHLKIKEFHTSTRMDGEYDHAEN